MKLIKFRKWKVFGQIHNPFSKEGLTWELLFVFRLSKTFTLVNKGKASVSTYFINIGCVSIMLQKIEQRLKLC
jgi:hypothetical protein